MIDLPYLLAFGAPRERHAAPGAGTATRRPGDRAQANGRRETPELAVLGPYSGMEEFP
jgi:hypothetical protein